MKIIVAPLNWGLGHASRCIPIIKALKKAAFTPIIASDGASLNFLRKEFSSLSFLELPSYHVRYHKFVKISLLFTFFKIQKEVKLEHKIITDFIKQNSDVVGIISDNRFGVYHEHIPSVYMTHQLRVLSGIFTAITSFYHQKIIRKFDECWVPDSKKTLLSLELSNFEERNIPVRFVGVLSRFEKRKVAKEWDITILLSGPEPRRTRIEKSLILKFRNTKQRVLLIQGKIEANQKIHKHGNLSVINFMLTKELEYTLNASDKVISRSGYTSLMDFSILKKKVVLVPTTGQNEQEYLAKMLNMKYSICVIRESEIKKTDFAKLEFNQIPESVSEIDPSLFDLFKRE